MGWAAVILLTGSTALGQSAGEEGSVLDPTPFSGLMCNLLCCFLSGLGAVFIEKLLKGKGSGDLSIFATNIHMATHTLLLNGAVLVVSAVLGGSSSSLPF